MGLFKGSGSSHHGSGYGGYGPSPGYGGGYGQGGYGQQPTYVQQQPPKKSGLSSGAGLALGNNPVFRCTSKSSPHAIFHVQVQVEACWEVCSLPTVSNTYMMTVVILVMMLVMIMAMIMVVVVMTMAASSFWRIIHA